MRKHIITGALALAFGALLALGQTTTVLATGVTHVVRPGETLFSIALHYGSSVHDVAAANGIFNPSYIQAGQRLTIPGGRPIAPPVQAASHGSAGGTYVVKFGDTLYSIAWRNGTTVSALLATNKLGNPDLVYAGQRLVIPGTYTPPHYPPSQPAPSKPCGHYHRVAYGETLSGIAWRAGTSVYALARANGVRYPYMIYAGQTLHIPCDGGSPPVAHPPVYHKPPPYKAPAPRPRATARPSTSPAACSRAVQIVVPHDRAHVSGTVHIVGTADIESFQFYKLEYAPGHTPLASEFASIGQTVHNRVRDSTLGVWYVGNLPAGDYTLRLTAVDNTGNFPRPCDVRLKVNR